MTKAPAVRILLAGILLFLGSITHAHAQGRYTPENMLDPRLAPKFGDVSLSTPSGEELKACTVVAVPGPTKLTGGFMLLDGNKKPLRRFYVSKDGGKVDLWSYYKDGVEVYREFDSRGSGSPDNFRWLNSAGMKWGVGAVDPKTGRGVITQWQMISAEEAAFEAFQAVAKNDFARLQALLITPDDCRRLKLPANEISRITQTQAQSPKKFSELARSLNIATAKFDVIEGATPSCDTTGDVETIRYPNRAIRYEIDGKHKWLHTREMVRVGVAWRLVDAPSDKDASTAGPNVAGPASNNPQLEKLLNQLAQLDATPPAGNATPKDPKIHAFYQKRVALLQQIVVADKADQSEGWYKQLFDNLAAAAQNSGDDSALKQMKDGVVRQMPGSNLAAYAVYRESWTRYVIAMQVAENSNKKIAAAQDQWLDDLAEFVKKYSKAEDTAEALHQLAIGCEFGGKIEEAKRWYKQLFESFPNHHLANRSRGSVERLSLIGNTMKLAATRLDNGQLFDIGTLKSKFVLVLYWRSQNGEQYKDDFARLKLKLASAKDVELVTINLDDDADTARKAIAATQAPGIHLYQSPSNNSGGGLNSPLATQYGIHMLPTLFLVNRDGRVTNNALQVGDIETELRKVQ